jgi:hypothetical protein
MKINLKYLQDNIDLEKLLEKLDKTTEYVDGDNINRKGDEIDIGEEVLNSNLFNTLSKLSRLGKLLSTISKNFKFIKDVRIDLATMDFFLTCTYSKLNKTYYMEVCEIRGYNGGVSIMYKSKSKESVLKKMDRVRKLALTKNIFPGK